MDKLSLLVVFMLTSGLPNPLLTEHAQASSDGRAVLRYGDKGIVVSRFNTCVRTQWSVDNDACTPPAPPASIVPPPPEPRLVVGRAGRTVYFDFNEVKITPEAAQILDSLATMLRSDTQIRQVRMVGFADRIGSDADNKKLSEKRAEAVHDYLVSRGFTKMGAPEIRWVGESIPATQCPDGMKRRELIACLAEDRRVKLEINYLTQLSEAE